MLLVRPLFLRQRPSENRSDHPLIEHRRTLRRLKSSWKDALEMACQALLGRFNPVELLQIKASLLRVARRIRQYWWEVGYRQDQELSRNPKRSRCIWFLHLQKSVHQLPLCWKSTTLRSLIGLSWLIYPSLVISLCIHLVELSPSFLPDDHQSRMLITVQILWGRTTKFPSKPGPVLLPTNRITQCSIARALQLKPNSLSNLTKTSPFQFSMRLKTLNNSLRAIDFSLWDQ